MTVTGPVALPLFEAPSTPSIDPCPLISITCPSPITLSGCPAAAEGHVYGIPSWVNVAPGPNPAVVSCCSEKLSFPVSKLAEVNGADSSEIPVLSNAAASEPNATLIDRADVGVGATVNVIDPSVTVIASGIVWLPEPAAVADTVNVAVAVPSPGIVSVSGLGVTVMPVGGCGARVTVTASGKRLVSDTESVVLCPGSISCA